MALSQDTPRNYKDIGPRAGHPVQASSTIYAGSAVSIDTGGEVGPLNTSDAGFLGFAVSKADNSSGSAGDIKADIISEGYVELSVTGLDDNNDIGDTVYATDDNTFTLTASGAIAIGKVFSISDTSTTKCIVNFKSLHSEHWND